VQFRKALDQLPLLPDSPERKRQELEFRSALGAVLLVVKGYGAPEAGIAYAQARELWEQLGAPTEFLQIPFGSLAITWPAVKWIGRSHSLRICYI
jgi:hypothetical protein